MTASPGTRLVEGQTLNLIVEGPKNSQLPVQFTSPAGQIFKEEAAITVPSVGFQHNGIWRCIVTLDKKYLQLDIYILVLSKTGSSSECPACSEHSQPLCFHCCCGVGAGPGPRNP